MYEIFKILHDDVWPKIKKATDDRRLSGKGKSRFNIQEELNYWLGGKYAELESGATRDMFRKEFNRDGRMFPIAPDVLIRMLPHIKMGSKKLLRIHLLCLHEKSKIELFEKNVKENGEVHWRPKKRQDVVRGFPKIIIGWCGDHLQNAKLTG